MIKVDLDSYFLAIGCADTARLGVRIMQWSNYVKRRIPQLDSKAEMLLLEGDAAQMGSADWWFK